jgi:hypothetical protein
VCDDGAHDGVADDGHDGVADDGHDGHDGHDGAATATGASLIITEDAFIFNLGGIYVFR